MPPKKKGPGMDLMLMLPGKAGAKPPKKKGPKLPPKAPPKMAKGKPLPPFMSPGI